MSTVKKCANRKFCTLPEDYPLKNVKCRSTVTGKPADFSKLIKYIEENIVGRNVTFLGPFGRRKVVYCDYTASGRALHFIEDYILKEVLPLYASTYTSSNVTAAQSSFYRQEARDIIRNAVHASENDVVIFAGNGCTGALHKLMHALDLVEPPVVFVGSNEHHSVLLPWREVGAKVIRIAETKEGFLDLIDLENKLQKEKQLLNGNSRVQFIGCFSAASNITGILADDIATTVLLHQYGALSFWDYATAAPYVPLDMNPLLPGNDKGVHKDAIFFSGHKFVGGVQSPGVLVIKKQLFKNEVPERSTGGAFFVSRENCKNLMDIEAREEGGSGAIVDSIRMGLAMHLKQTLGPPNILLREQKITKTVLSFIRTIPEIILLGNGSHSVKRLPIFSFVVRHPRGVFLHHNFICSVLNDVFGIQARGGCTCAIPYAHDLLGIDVKLANAYEEVLLEDERLDRSNLRHYEEHSNYKMLRPGFTRISLPYFMSDAEVSFVLEAVKMVATEGWKLLPQYALYPETGEWKHRTNLVFRERKWLSSFRFIDGKMTANERKISGQSPFPQDPSDCLQMARNIFNKARKMAHRYPLPDQTVILDEKADELRWFMLPSEAQDLLLGNCQNVKTKVPFTPGEYCGTRNNSISEDSVDSVPLVASSISPSLDFSNSFYSRHNSLTSVDSSPLKRSSSFFAEKSCSDCGCLSPYHSGINREASPISRTRCYSLESSSASPPNRLLSSVETNGHCSCGSQTDISDAESISKDGHVSADFSDFSDMGITTLFPANENENIKAYVKGVTEDIATEIKTEIREVIATVDNVLSESMENLDINAIQYDKRFSSDFRRTSSIPLLIKPNAPPHPKAAHSYTDGTSYCHNQRMLYGADNTRPHSAGLRKRLYSYDGKPCPDASTNMSDQVAVYLAELTSEMVTEMKSELREMVNAVDEIISPSNGDKNNSGSFDSHHGRNRTVSVTLQEEWEDSDESQSQNEGSYRSCKTAAAVQEIKEIKNDGQCEETKSLTKSDSSSDSGVAEICTKESPTKISKRKISVIAREPRSSPDVREYLKEAEIEFKIEKSEEEKPCSFDKRKRSFESVTLQPKWHCPPKTVWKPTVEAIREFDMIREGDRILICLSGGKDSLSLLHTLHQYQYYSQSYGVTFTFGAVTVDPGSSAYDPRPLIPYLHALGIHYLYDEQKIFEKTEEIKFASSFCCRLKRGRLYKAARDNNYNVLALGQHLDDLAESFLMSAFHNGRLKSMKAHYYIRERDLRVIRPFVYVREKHLRQFAENRKLPVITENYVACFEAPKERHRTKQLLAQQEILHPKLFASLKSALQPLISFRQAGDENNLYKKRKTTHSDDVDVNYYGSSDTEEEDPNA